MRTDLEIKLDIVVTYMTSDLSYFRDDAHFRMLCSRKFGHKNIRLVSSMLDQGPMVGI